MIVVTEYKCGCKITTERYYSSTNPAQYSILYCPKHSAAPFMYEALHTIKNNWALIKAGDSKIITVSLNKLLEALAEADSSRGQIEIKGGKLKFL